jgi:hypothetical protein
MINAPACLQADLVWLANQISFTCSSHHSQSSLPSFSSWELIGWGPIRAHGIKNYDGGISRTRTKVRTEIWQTFPLRSFPASEVPAHSCVDAPREGSYTNGLWINVIVSSLRQRHDREISYNNNRHYFWHILLDFRSNIACDIDTREVEIAHCRCLSAYLDSKKSLQFLGHRIVSLILHWTRHFPVL